MPPLYCCIPGVHNVSHGQGPHEPVMPSLRFRMHARKALEAGKGCLLSVVSLAGYDLHISPDHEVRKH